MQDRILKIRVLASLGFSIGIEFFRSQGPLGKSAREDKSFLDNIGHIGLLGHCSKFPPCAPTEGCQQIYLDYSQENANKSPPQRGLPQLPVRSGVGNALTKS